MTAMYQLLRRFFQAAGFVRRRLSWVFLIALGLNVLFGGAFYLAERHAQPELTLVDSVWWAMVTMTTVGYGDYYAQTPVGRFVISYPCMILGIGIIGYLVGTVAESIVHLAANTRKGLMQIVETDHVIICQCPDPDRVVRVVEELRKDPWGRTRDYVVIADAFEEIPEALDKANIRFLRGDPTREDALRRANVLHSAGVFVLARDPGDPRCDFESFAVGSICEQMEAERGAPIHTVVELVSSDHRRMMEKTNVDAIVSVDGIGGRLLVQEFLDPGVYAVVHELVTNHEGAELYTLHTRLAGRTVGELHRAILEADAPVQVLGIVRDGEHQLNPKRTTELREGDRLIVMADDRNDFAALEQMLA